MELSKLSLSSAESGIVVKLLWSSVVRQPPRDWEDDNDIDKKTLEINYSLFYRQFSKYRTDEVR